MSIPLCPLDSALPVLASAGRVARSPGLPTLAETQRSICANCNPARSVAADSPENPTIRRLDLSATCPSPR